jgi:hypothetical protein
MFMILDRVSWDVYGSRGETFMSLSRDFYYSRQSFVTCLSFKGETFMSLSRDFYYSRQSFMICLSFKGEFRETFMVLNGWYFKKNIFSFYLILDVFLFTYLIVWNEMLFKFFNFCDLSNLSNLSNETMMVWLLREFFIGQFGCNFLAVIFWL